MSDVEEIIDYIKQLKRGFDKELFESKINELTYVARTSGLQSDDFYILFKIWLNLSISIPKWKSLGVCLVPQDIVEERTVDYAFRWLLANYEEHSNFSRMAFLLDWLTAAMDCASIDMTALDSGYEILYAMLLKYDVLTQHALKMVYTLTKPRDVTRRRVLDLLAVAKRREGKKNMSRQIQVLLGLFKSYRPEFVPENVPAVAVHKSFKKIHDNLLEGFKIKKEQRSKRTKERHHLMWNNRFNSGGRNKKADPLVPDVEFTKLGSQQDDDNTAMTNHLDFRDPLPLLQHRLSWGAGGAGRPARLRALLCNQAGVTLLALAGPEDQAFLASDLRHQLTACFLETSPHSYAEKADFLNRLSALQKTLLQGVPVITWFLTQYLPFWNEQDYFAEILSLVEWISVDNSEQLSNVMEPLMKIYFRAHPMEQCAILNALTTMYCNLVYSSTRTRQHFMSSAPRNSYSKVLPQVASSLSEMCQKALQVNPEDMRVLHSCMSTAVRVSQAGGGAGGGGGALPARLLLALALLQPGALLLDRAAQLFVLYRKIFSQMKAANRHEEESYIVNRKLLAGYSCDFLHCLYEERAISERKSGLILDKLHPQLVAKLTDLFPETDSCFSLRNNLAFAPYTFSYKLPSDTSNKFFFETAVMQNFPNLSEFLRRTVRELQ